MNLEGNEECSGNYAYSTKDNPLHISNKSSQIYQQLICNSFLYLYVGDYLNFVGQNKKVDDFS